MKMAESLLGFLDGLAAGGDDGGRGVQELAGGVAVAAGRDRRRG